jgi:nucleotide-binding universal stress UspA family protein
MTMKSVLLYANQDSGLEGRLQAALDVARAFDAHIGCVQVTPFDSFIMGDPFGGVYALPSVLETVRESEDAHRASMEARLRTEGASWDWLRCDGSPAQIVVDRSRLADLIVLSLPEPGKYDGPLSMAADVALHARAPALAVPAGSQGVDCMGTAIVAWNGALEAAHALRLSLPMLRRADKVQIVTVKEDQAEFPATDASLYLARHDIASELHEWPAADHGSTAGALLDAARTLGGAYVVMGAYGRSRLRESVLGGTSREMLHHAGIPLVLAH